MPSSAPANPSVRASLLGLLIAALVCIPRIAGFDPGRLLWAEDGNVFIAQAHDLGIGSILHPYAGYFHLYPRLVALVGARLDVALQAAARSTSTSRTRSGCSARH